MERITSFQWKNGAHWQEEARPGSFIRSWTKEPMWLIGRNVSLDIFTLRDILRRGEIGFHYFGIWAWLLLLVWESDMSPNLCQIAQATWNPLLINLMLVYQQFYLNFFFYFSSRTCDVPNLTVHKFIITCSKLEFLTICS